MRRMWQYIEPVSQKPHNNRIEKGSRNIFANEQTKHRNNVYHLCRERIITQTQNETSLASQGYSLMIPKHAQTFFTKQYSPYRVSGRTFQHFIPNRRKSGYETPQATNNSRKPSCQR